MRAHAAHLRARTLCSKTVSHFSHFARVCVFGKRTSHARSFAHIAHRTYVRRTDFWVNLFFLLRARLEFYVKKVSTTNFELNPNVYRVWQNIDRIAPPALLPSDKISSLCGRNCTYTYMNPLGFTKARKCVAKRWRKIWQFAYKIWHLILRGSKLRGAQNFASPCESPYRLLMFTK